MYRFGGGISLQISEDKINAFPTTNAVTPLKGTISLAPFKACPLSGVPPHTHTHKHLGQALLCGLRVLPGHALHALGESAPHLRGACGVRGNQREWTGGKGLMGGSASGGAWWRVHRGAASQEHAQKSEQGPEGWVGCTPSLALASSASSTGLKAGLPR